MASRRKHPKSFRREQHMSSYAKAISVFGKKTKAIALLQSELRKAPDNCHFINKLAFLYLSEEFRNEPLAIKLFEKSHALNPQDPITINMLGSLYAGEGRYKEAEKILLKGLEHAPDNARLHAKLGDVFLQQKKFEEAEKHLLKAKEFDKSNPMTFELCGNLYFQMEKYDEAIKYFREGLTLYPQSEWSLTKLGKALGITKRYSEAEKVLSDGLDLFPHSIHMILTLGGIFDRQNKQTDAVNLYTNALLSLPEHPKLIQRLNKILERGDVHEIPSQTEPNSRPTNTFGAPFRNTNATGILKYG